MMLILSVQVQRHGWKPWQSFISEVVKADTVILSLTAIV